MKTQFKKFFLLLLFFSGVCCKAQTIEYSYDHNGNRTQRKLYVCPNCPNTHREAKKDTTKQKLAEHYGISAYPNPTLDKVNLNIANSPSKEQIDLELADPEGKIVFTQKNVPTQNQIDMYNYQQGIYYLRVTIGKDVVIYKIVKVQ